MAEFLTGLLGLLWEILSKPLGRFVRRRLGSRDNVEIRRITSAKDQDIFQLIALYENNFPANERDDFETIIRWLEEVEAETLEGRCKLIDLFLVAKVGSRVIGWCYAHYYVASQFLFVSFLVVDREMTEARRGSATYKLLEFIAEELKRKQLRRCRGIIFEVEHPQAVPEERQREAAARIRHFAALARAHGWIARTLQLNYLQPRLDIWSGQFQEQPLALMYIRTRGRQLSRDISRKEAKAIVGFIYNEVYGDHFEDDRQRDREFRTYLRQLHAQVTDDLPQRVAVSTNPPAIGNATNSVSLSTPSSIN